jgi:hypothetical protein
LNTNFSLLDSSVCTDGSSCLLDATSEAGGIRINSGYRCVTIPSVTSATDNVYFWAAPFASVVIRDVGCHCNETCTGTLAALRLETADGAAIEPDAVLTCATGASVMVFEPTTDLDANMNLGEGLRMDTTNSPTTTDAYTLCFHYDY